MTKKTRLTILIACVLCFLVISPVLVLYSMGYRFDFEKMKITSTGGINVRSYPAPEQVIIDAKAPEKPSLFSDKVFVQGLLPSMHTVLVEKTGYYSYSKTVQVIEKEVTKLENILLIKKNIQFEIVEDITLSPFNVKENFILKNNSLYYSDIPENGGITAAKKAIPVLNNLVSFSVENNHIFWLGTDGFLYQSDLANITSAKPDPGIKINLTPIKIIKTGFYKIISSSPIFINNNGSLLTFDDKTNNFYVFSSPVTDAKISPDNKNIIYFNNDKVYISALPTDQGTQPNQKTVLYQSSEDITDCIWLNNYYVIITTGDKIVISEIDYRDIENFVTLPQMITVSPEQNIEVKKPKIFFNRQEGKLYILSDDILLSSERIYQ